MTSIVGLRIPCVWLANIGAVTRLAIVAWISYLPKLLVNPSNLTAYVALEKLIATGVAEVLWLKKHALTC